MVRRAGAVKTGGSRKDRKHGSFETPKSFNQSFVNVQFLAFGKGLKNITSYNNWPIHGSDDQCAAQHESARVHFKFIQSCCVALHANKDICSRSPIQATSDRKKKDLSAAASTISLRLRFQAEHGTSKAFHKEPNISRMSALSLGRAQ